MISRGMQWKRSGSILSAEHIQRPGGDPTRDDQNTRAQRFAPGGFAATPSSVPDGSVASGAADSRGAGDRGRSLGGGGRRAAASERTSGARLRHRVHLGRDRQPVLSAPAGASAETDPNPAQGVERSAQGRSGSGRRRVGLLERPAHSRPHPALVRGGVTIPKTSVRCWTRWGSRSRRRALSPIISTRPPARNGKRRRGRRFCGWRGRKARCSCSATRPASPSGGR